MASETNKILAKFIAGIDGDTMARAVTKAEQTMEFHKAQAIIVLIANNGNLQKENLGLFLQLAAATSQDYNVFIEPTPVYSPSIIFRCKLEPQKAEAMFSAASNLVQQEQINGVVLYQK